MPHDRFNVMTFAQALKNGTSISIWSRLECMYKLLQYGLRVLELLSPVCQITISAFSGWEFVDALSVPLVTLSAFGLQTVALGVLACVQDLWSVDIYLRLSSSACCACSRHATSFGGCFFRGSDWWVGREFGQERSICAAAGNVHIGPVLRCRYSR